MQKVLKMVTQIQSRTKGDINSKWSKILSDSL